MVVCANPHKSADWREAWLTLPTDAPLKAGDSCQPSIDLARVNADRRKQFDNRYLKATKQLPMPIIEIGGWNNIAHLAELGLGVGLVSESTISHRANKSSIRGIRHNPRFTSQEALSFVAWARFPQTQTKKSSRRSRPTDRPQGACKNEPSLNDFAGSIRNILKEASRAFFADVCQ